ncbi:MAG: right-handed parallel beta-helix repeat-containing protein [Stellaceae bacterium]
MTSNPVSCTVNCAAGGTLASAVALQPRTTGRLTITIKGTCVASTDDLPSRITLQGATGATLQAPKATTDPVLGISGIGVELSKLTISGGVYALRGHQGAAFDGTDLVIEKASTADVLLNHAVATLNTSTIESSASDGIDAVYGGTISLNGGVVQKNTAIGVSATESGSADIFGGAMLEDNGVAGAYAGSGGSVDVSAGSVTKNGSGSGGIGGIDVGTGGAAVVEGSTTSVSGNTGDGIAVFEGGVARIDDAKIEDNSGEGLLLDQGAFAKIREGAIVEGNEIGIYVGSGTVTVGDTLGPATIQSNKSDGIFLRTNSVALFGNSANKIIDNSGWGILCTGSPSNPLIYGTVGTVSGNKAGRIDCKTSP